jgi:hypothetical protein
MLRWWWMGRYMFIGRGGAVEGREKITTPDLALENIFDIPCAVKYADNFSRRRGDSIENDVPAKGKTLNARSQLISVTPQAGLAGQQFHRLVDFVDKTIRTRLAVISNVAPNLD